MGTWLALPVDAFEKSWSLFILVGSTTVGSRNGNGG